MPRTKISDLFVRQVRPPKNGRIEYFDVAMPAFGLRITANGHKSWVYFYRFGGRKRRFTLGTYPKLRLKDAREIARKAAQAVSEGRDPAAERYDERATCPGTFADVAEQFIELYAKRRQRTWRETKRYLVRDVVPVWRDRPIEEITRGNVLTLLDRAMAEGKATKANRLHSHLRKLFNWAIERGFIDASPILNVGAPGKEVKRDRVLADTEIAAIWEASGKLGHPFDSITRLLFLTAQRRDEVASMRWEDINLERAVWCLPRETTKMDRAHEVPLSSYAVGLLERLPRFGIYVLSSGRAGDKPVSGWSATKRRLDALSSVADWRLHDIRRTAASGMARLNVPPHVLSKILGHMSDGQGVTGIYNRFAYEAEKLHALQAWGQYLSKLVVPQPDNIMEIGR